jgi:S-adenosylmethionine hydrolase
MSDALPRDFLPRRITLLTDFGTADGYVASMRGVLASLAPRALVDDATHQIGAGDVAAAAWALSRYWRLYPEGAIHVVVVDPGVGSERRALAVESFGRFVLAPDNGVITRVLEDAPSSRVVAIENEASMRHPVSNTFHGRDIFAPAAAYLANGGDFKRLGSGVIDPVRLALEQARREDGVVKGEVIHVDGFGNLITNIPGEWVVGSTEILVEGRPVGPVRAAYSEVPRGDRLALVGSAELLEISIREGSAADALESKRGARVIVRFG